MSTTIGTNTFQAIELATPAGKKFLRRVASRREEWSVYANAADGWRLHFTRRILSTVPGEPCATVDVSTDAIVSQTGSTGFVKNDDCESGGVIVPETKYVSGWSYTAATVAYLLADGWRFWVRHSAGSISSRLEGLAYVSFIATKNTLEVTVDETVYCRGRQISHGAPQS